MPGPILVPLLGDQLPFTIASLEGQSRRLASNPRIGRIYGTWDRMEADRQGEYLASAADILGGLAPAQSGWAR